MRWWARIFLALGLGLGLTWQVQAGDSERFRAKLPTVSTISRALSDASLVSAAGRHFELYRYEARSQRQGRARHRFLVQGGLHGNEAVTSQFVVWLSRRYARGESALNALPSEDVAIDFLPYANPDGSAEQNRYNTRGVNLNRNFGVLWGITRENPGSASFSEPETRAIQRLFEEERYTAAVDVHGYVNWVVAPSDPETMQARAGKQAVDAKRRERYRAWREALGSEMKLLPGYQLKTAGSLGDGGAFEDWAFWSEGTLAYCLELESFQRFVQPYRRDFADITKPDEGPAIDLFKRYEAFIARMFARAIEIEGKAAGETLPPTLAVQP